MYIYSFVKKKKSDYLIVVLQGNSENAFKLFFYFYSNMEFLSLTDKNYFTNLNSNKQEHIGQKYFKEYLKPSSNLNKVSSNCDHSKYMVFKNYQ